jgi:hypothetical protein
LKVEPNSKLIFKLQTRIPKLGHFVSSPTGDPP